MPSLGRALKFIKKRAVDFLNLLFQECLQLELGLQSIPFDMQRALRLEYKGIPLQHGFVADFVCFDRIILEIKAVSSLADEHRSQVLNYLNATSFKLGLLVNFGHHPKLEWERLVL
jgi:GxxExxY protein